jgi:hypothetical protein
MIKKFKNGKILLQVKSIDFDGLQVSESFYHDDMFFSDLSLNQINGYMYLVDYNTQLVYEYIQLGGLQSYNPIYSICNVQNALKEIIDGLTEYKKVYLFPLTKKESESLLIDLDGGY